MQVERYAIPVTTAADGSATVYSEPITGKVVTVRYAKGNFTDGVDFTITAEFTGETIWTQSDVNASVIVAPRQPTHSTAGVAALYAAAGSPVLDYICLARDRVKIVIASGGNATSGTFHLVIG
jgi:hypothetical protein